MKYSSIEDTIAAPATLPGTGAIGIIRLSGSGCLEAIGKLVRFKSGSVSDFKGYSIHFGTIFSDDNTPLDEVLVSIFKAPHSYTGEDSAEISYHASAFIASEIMRLLLGLGVRMAEPGEFTQRAYTAGKMDLVQAEAVADVIASNSATSHRVAFNQMRGGVSNELLKMRSKLLEALSLVELELDFSEEDVEFADRAKLSELLNSTSDRIKRLCDTFRIGNAIKNGIPVAIVGAPNVGKSTLLNTLLGEDRAIVSDVPGTTRDTVEEVFNIGGILYRLIDTAGLRQSTDVVERIGIERTENKLSEADIVIALLDSGESVTKILTDASALLRRCDLQRQRLIFAPSKIDLLPNGSLLGQIVIGLEDIAKSAGPASAGTLASGQAEGVAGVVVSPISAPTGQGIDGLKACITRLSGEYSANSSSVLISNARHHAALLGTLEHLRIASNGLSSGLPTDLLAQELHDATDALSSITGLTIDPDEVLGNIFKNFCIGK